MPVSALALLFVPILVHAQAPRPAGAGGKTAGATRGTATVTNDDIQATVKKTA
jgi:hypothetical protein